MNATTESADRRQRILIAEDSLTQARRLRYILEKQDYHVTHAANGRLALEAAQQETPALIISDVVMPEMDGYDLCRAIKTSGLMDVPVILVTTLSDPADVIKGLACRADNFILKPYDDEYLVSRVQFVLMNRAMRQTEQGGLAVEIFFNGERHTITADRLQILNLLLSTYDAAIQRNKDLMRAQEALRHSEAFINSLFDHIPIPISVKDARDLRYVRVNHAFEQLVGYDRRELVGKMQASFFDAAETEFFVAAERRAIDGRCLVEIPEARVQTKTRGVRTVRSRKVPVIDHEGTLHSVLSIGEDITERLVADRQLSEAKQEAERANQAKSDFLSRMSHDLRTPLNAVLGFAQLLQADDLTADQQDSVSQILRGGEHLLELINEVLDLARIESGHLALSPEPVPVGEVVQDVISLIRPLAGRRGITIDDALSACDDCHVLADRQRLKQVLMNLVSNAIKYNREGGRLSLGRDIVAGRTQIRITDTGEGIPAEQLALLFQPFERLRAADTSVEGTGLGLALSKALAEAMGGTLGVVSEVGRGSTFWIELAQAPVPRTAAPTAFGHGVPVSAHQTTSTVLCIEANPADRQLIERVLLRRPGITLVAAATGQAGIDLARANPPHLIVLDLQLPDISGLEVLRRLQEDARTRLVPVVVLSADADAISAVKTLHTAGPIASVAKPPDIGALLQVLDSALTKAN